MKRTKSHILFWIVYFLIAYSTDLVLDEDATLMKEIIFFITQNLFLFYGLLFVLRKFSIKSNTDIGVSIGRLIAVLSVFGIVRYFVRYYLLTKYFQKEYGDLPIYIWLTTCVIWVINSFLLAAAYFYAQTSIQKHKALQQSLKLQLEQEREKVRFENAALRAQINPHFLYNTLDFLYAQALPLSERLSDGIIRLSEMMRYSIRAQDAYGLVNLREEIEHLENIIAIHQLRFDHALHIRFEPSSKSIANLRIIPLILITLVENVLKHGRLNDPDGPAIIRIDTSGTTLCMTTENQKRTGPKELSTGIGLDNTRKRLNAAYSHHYTLDTREDEHRFFTTLRIPLTHPIHHLTYDHQLYYPG